MGRLQSLEARARGVILSELGWRHTTATSHLALRRHRLLRPLGFRFVYQLLLVFILAIYLVRLFP
jgi:hypothetical protein